MPRAAQPTLSGEGLEDFDLDLFRATDWRFRSSSGGRDIHPYPARFIPEIPRAAIRILRQPKVVLDPFCGAGTTLHEALQRPSLDVRHSGIT